MLRLSSVIDAAVSDAHRAEDIMRNAGARRALQTDPERALLTFELRARDFREDSGMRAARAERRDLGVRNARRGIATG